MKILVAEDNLFYRHLLQATLTEWGFEVVAVADGDAAWEVLQGPDAPKLAILDWLMPGKNGPDVCREVRALPRAQPTYIILLTVKGTREDIIAGLESGADDYMRKPFDREELHARLQVGLRIVGLQASLAARVQDLEAALLNAQKMEAVGRLAGGVAHDFNNLLTVILGSSDLLLASAERGDTERELLLLVKEAGERGAALTHQLLAFGRKQVLAPMVLDLNVLVTNLGKMLRRLIGEHVELETRLSPALYPVKADPGQLEQVLMNLVVNARDAMPSGGRVTIATASVTLDEADTTTETSARPGPYALLAVSDTGCGMDEETKAHLFEPFFTTKELGKGTGLGLATVYGIVKQSGGLIRVESAPGRGSTFRVYLPRSPQAVSVSSAAPESAGRPPANHTVLLVEDETPVRDVIREVLQGRGYTVLEAADAYEAQRLGERDPRPIDLLLTDVVVPRGSGPQLAGALAPLRPGMKVLYMSGYTDDETVRRQVLEPGLAFLQKPFTPPALVAKVSEVLRG